MKKGTYILLGVSIITLLFTHCNTSKHTMSVAQLDRISPIPSKILVDTTHYEYSIPKYTSPKLTDPKDYFEQSFQLLQAMLQGNEKPNFERAVFLSENPYHNNKYTYDQFQDGIFIPLYSIKKIIEANDRSDTMNFDAHVGANGKFKMADMRFLPKEKKELYKKALANWAIFEYMTDTTFVSPFYNVPKSYSTEDPFGKKDWSNTQVMNLLLTSEQKGNCFSLTALYKILADRLGSDARICTAPQHTYIQHKDPKGDYYNLELATAGHPGDGTIQTLTHTTSDAIKSGIALRDYTEQQSIGLCMINLAKSYERYFDTKDDEFLLRCAEATIQYDSLNLNALLLKQQVLDERVTKYAVSKGINTISKLKQDKNIQQTVIDLEKQTALLYRLGYRQMPLDMQQIIMSGNYPDSGFVDKNPSPFASIHPKDIESTTYKSLSGGLFQEVYDQRPTENYGHFVFDTKTKQIKDIDTKAQDNFLIDPVAFAYDFGARMYDARLGRFMSVDKMNSTQVGWSPYKGFFDNPIRFVDIDGNVERDALTGKVVFYKTSKKLEDHGASTGAELDIPIKGYWGYIKSNSGAQMKAFKTELVPNEYGQSTKAPKRSEAYKGGLSNCFGYSMADGLYILEPESIYQMNSFMKSDAYQVQENVNKNFQLQSGDMVVYYYSDGSIRHMIKILDVDKKGNIKAYSNDASGNPDIPLGKIPGFENDPSPETYNSGAIIQGKNLTDLNKQMILQGGEGNDQTGQLINVYRPEKGRKDKEVKAGSHAEGSW